MENNSIINPSSIVNILTLRYDPNLSPNLPIKTWSDFKPNLQFADINFIENSISNYIKQKIETLDAKTVSIALSGGVDSTLVLSLIRKMKPDLNIQAVSIKFADSVDETNDASKIAETFDAEHHIVHLENYLTELPRAISMIKMPFWDLHWYYVVKKSQSLSKVLISGDGGDELFGGYTFRYEKFLSLTSESSSPKLFNSLPFFKLCSPYCLDITLATSPTSSVNKAIFVNSLKYLTPCLFIQLSTTFCAFFISIVLFLI